MEHYQSHNKSQAALEAQLQAFQQMQLGKNAQSKGSSVQEATVTTLSNILADKIESLHAGITTLRSDLSPVLVPCGSNSQTHGLAAQPPHSCSALAQLQTLIEQVCAADQDVRDIIAGLRV